MKSITKKISLLLVFSAILFLSSCLESSGDSYTGDREYSYITRDLVSGKIIAKTSQRGYWITSESIQSLEPETAAFISFQINDDTETIMTGENRDMPIYKATIGGKPIVIDQNELRLMEAPDNVEGDNFVYLSQPLYSITRYFGDLWLFTYDVTLKEGETAEVNFYLETKDVTPLSLSDEVIIDVRVTKKGGEATEGAKEEIVRNSIVADMSSIRGMFSGSDHKQAKLQLRYYRVNNKNEVELYTSPKAEPYIIQLKDQ